MSASEVAAGVYRLEEDDGGRALCQFVIRGSRRALVVDTGLPESPARGVIPLLEELGLAEDPVVLLTHPDADHCGGTAALQASIPGAEVVANAPDCRLLGDPERTIAERYQPYAESDGIEAPTPAVERMRARLGGRYRVDRELEQEETLDLGGHPCRLLLLPGHSPGHAAAWLPEHRVLVAADAVMGRGIPKYDGSLLYAPQLFSPAVYRATVERIRALGPELLLCAHEPPRAGAAVDEFLSDSVLAVEELEQLVQGALEAGASTLAEICSAVHAGYGGLPSGRSADLAMTVAGILGDRVNGGAVAVDDSRSPRQFRLVSP